MPDIFVLIGKSGNIPYDQIEYHFGDLQREHKLVVVDEDDRLATEYFREDVDRIIDIRRGNWDFFADHKTTFGFANAVDMLLPKDPDMPWKGEGKRMVLTELLTREAGRPRPSLAHLAAVAGDLSPAEACRLAEIDTDGLDGDELEKLSDAVTSGYHYDFRVAEWDRRLKAVSIADWLESGPESVLFVNGFGRGWGSGTSAVGNALLAAVRDHASLGGHTIDSVAYADVAAPLKGTTK